MILTNSNPDRHVRESGSATPKRSDDTALGVAVRKMKATWRLASRRGSPVLLLWVASALFLAVSYQVSSAATQPLKLSVYCTAGDVQQQLATPDGRERVLRALQPLPVSRLFLEGRRGDEYVSPEQLRAARDFFARHDIHCRGGIATVPGSKFGTRQTGGLGWLNYESPETRAGVAQFFTENAPLFDELIVDDFYCTGDVSPESERAKGARDWGEYRRDLLVSLIEPMMLQPARAASRHPQLIIKFPQWYDRFHVFGYDPPRMAAQSRQVWVGTEVRNPQTRRMGFVQPTEGYMNYRWLTSVAGKKVRGAWFDHIECSAQNFVDQAYQSVLAGAHELTLFHLGDLMAGHPGDALLAKQWPELRTLAARVQGRRRRGLAFYKPPGSESSENMYLADYLGMIGLPILPVAEYPKDARVAFLPVQAAADARLLERMRRHLREGATLILTPALLEALGAEAFALAGVEPIHGERMTARAFQSGDQAIAAEQPVELASGLKPVGGAVAITALVGERSVPFLTRHAQGRGHVWVLNVRTFSNEDFGQQGEWLLAPQPLGLAQLPQPLADTLRASFLAPLGIAFRAPSGVSLVLFGRDACVYSFREQPTTIQWGGRAVELPAHGLVWLK